jgi:hypothetical protein
MLVSNGFLELKGDLQRFLEASTRVCAARRDAERSYILGKIHVAQHTAEVQIT